jgi:thiol-disulfide isomerase/thioredoxin
LAEAEESSSEPKQATELVSSDEKLLSGDQLLLKLVDWQGFQEVIDQKRGQVVVVDIWSTSCAPCMKEFPHLVALSQRKDVQCISLNVDYVGLSKKPPSSYRDQVLAFLKQQQADQVHNLLATIADQEVYEHFEIDSIPAVVIYDSQGQIVRRLTDSSVGGTDGVSYSKHVLPLIDSL